MAAPQADVQTGPELEEIAPEIIGFTPLSAGLEGGKKLKLLPSPWPTDNLPPASATLLSVAPKRGLLAAASPDKVVVASTEKVRKAFQEKAEDKDVVASFSPDATLPVPRLRHVVFSTDEDFLVVSAENGGGLVVYALDDLLKGNTQPGVQIATNNTPVRALLPNPAVEQAHYMAVVLDTGRLDVVDVTTGNTKPVHDGGVTCASWSVKGKAFVAGFEDGTAAIHLVSALDQVKGRVPRPPELAQGYRVSAVNWLSNEELFLVYSPSEDGEETLYYFVNTNKTYSSFTFRRTPYELIFSSMDGPPRTPPPRFSVQRLRNWEPALDDMLIVTAANSADVGIILRSSEPIDPALPTVKEYQMAGLLDNRKATVPRNLEDTGDSALIGDALDLSSKEKVEQPSRRLDEITESPTPLPAYFLLTHEGLLAAWWVVWDRSLEAGTAFQGLTFADSPSSTAFAEPTPQSTQTPSAFGQATPAQSSPFANVRSAPAFGSPSAPTGNLSFGKASLPSTSPFATPAGQATFGTPGLGSKPSAFGAPSQIPTKVNPFGSGGSASQASATPNPFGAGGSASQNATPNPFAATAAKFASGAPGGSPFSSFSNKNDGKSGFGALGQNKPLSSFGSTVTVDSKASGIGSTLPSLTTTPAQQSGSVFGSGATSSFPSFTSTQSGSTGTDVGDRGRDEATPTPQSQPHLKEVSGIFGGKFELKSSFKGDGSAKDDLPKPQASSGGSVFGNGFSSALSNAASKSPATPIKPDASNGPLFPSTTPATAPRPSNGLFSGLRAESATPKADPLKESVPEDAPLPPDWRSTNPPKTDDEIPPLAGSPPVNVEAPSVSDDIPSSPLDDDEDGDLSNPDAEEDDDQDQDDQGDEVFDEEEEEDEEETGDEESEQSSPTDAGRTSRQSGTGLNFGNRSNNSPQIFPAPPTPLQTIQRPPSNRSSAPQSLFGGTRRDPLGSSARPPSKPPTPQPIFSDLVDDEDERIRQELESEIEPSRTLAPFIARQEYTEAALNKTGHAAQIEIVYRDINSMVDTLGLNSRSLKAFVEFHEHSERHGNLTRSALEEVLDQGHDDAWFEKWSLCEIEDLKVLEDELEKEMDEGRAKKVVDKLSKSVRMIQENAKLLSKVNDERRRIMNSKDPEKLEALRKASLPKELADQQKALRRDYAQLLTQLAKAEDALILLRSKLASHNAKNGQTSAVPSVEAIKKTINKLIAITKEKNHDITLLESQLRKVTLVENSRPPSSSSRHAATPLRKSRTPRAESPFATPPTSKGRMSLLELNRVAMTPEQSDTPSKGYGLFYTPQGSPSSGKNLSTLAEMVDDDLDRLRETAKRRRNIAASLASALADRGVKKTTVA